MSDHRKFVRRFSLDGWPLRSQYGWYLLKKAACLAVVLTLVLLAYARLPREHPWLPVVVPGVIAAVGFWLSGRIRMQRDVVDTAERKASR